MKIMFIGSEATPFAKTGGLADVLGSLPYALALQGHEVSLVLPKHLAIKRIFQDKLTLVKSFYVRVHERLEYVGVETLKQGNVTCYFIDNEYYFGYRENLYGDYDDGERYGYFNQAIAFMFQELNYYPDILHLNDWQTGLIPYYINHFFNMDKNYQKIKTVLTIHNLAYQGMFPKSLIHYLNVPEKPELEYNQQINFLKTGIVMVDCITTVSETYAKEILSEPFGEGLSCLLNERKQYLVGVMNGLDYEAYNPQEDKMISKNYDVKTFTEGKVHNKKNLLKMFHLDQNTNLPVFGMVSRLTEAKGFSLIEAILEPLLQEKRLKFVLLGSGDHHIQSVFTHLKQKYGSLVGVYFGYSDTIAKAIYAGADFFLMPSRFEPCGLAQLISMRYGTLPIVRETGGLKDSVISYTFNQSQATGFSFINYYANDLLKAIDEALNVYADPLVHQKLIKRAMEVDFGWKKSAERYDLIYRQLLEE